MNKKLSHIAFSLMLSACVTSPEPRPEPYLKSEELLQQGISAYESDNFSEAQQKFSQALELYLSFDNNKGIALTRLNLAETALASSDFDSVKSYFQQLKQQAVNNDFEAELKRKLILLEARLQFEQQQYPAALATLQPLLAELDEQKKTDEAQLNLLAIQARLEVSIAPLANSNGLSRFQSALAETEPKPDYQALLKRILAITALKRSDYQTASSLLTEALAYYQEQANRRSIAACLEELAELEIARQHRKSAQEYLKKALLIRQWLKNDYKSAKIKQRLATLSQDPLH